MNNGQPRSIYIESKRQKWQIWAFLLAVAVTLYLAYRILPPGKGERYGAVIDSLKREISKSEKREKLALDSMNHYKILSETWLKLADQKKERVIVRTIYAKDTSNINSLSHTQLDSSIRARYPDK